MSNPTARPAPRHSDSLPDPAGEQPEIPGIRLRPEDVFTREQWLQWRDERRAAAARRSRERRALTGQWASLVVVSTQDHESPASSTA